MSIHSNSSYFTVLTINNKTPGIVQPDGDMANCMSTMNLNDWPGGGAGINPNSSETFITYGNIGDTLMLKNIFDGNAGQYVRCYYTISSDDLTPPGVYLQASINPLTTKGYDTVGCYIPYVNGVPQCTLGTIDNPGFCEIIVQ
jgi:hypothetical protein